MPEAGASARILERGDVFFAYRPRVEQEHPRSIDDLQRFFLILRPDGEERWRRIVVGRKRMPDPARHERLWAYVDRVERCATGVERDFRGEDYETKTRGARHLPAARPAGEGRYAIAHHGRHAHLAYALELPEELGAPQRALHIERQASIIVAVANPERRAPVGLLEERTPELPEEWRRHFRGRRFAPLVPEMLDAEGCELVLIGAAEDAEAELGIHLDAERESEHDAQTFRALGMSRREHPAAPLLDGAWE